MRTTRTIALLIALGIVPVALVSCGGGGVYGEEISDADVTSLADVLANPAAFDGRTVKLTGEIGNECPTGCWFELQDGGASIHVDIAPYGLAIPQEQGSSVTVEGTVKITESRPMVIGKGVAIR
jgi:hypothetical protein